MLMECIEPTRGTMLSKTWSEKQHDVELRTNIFRSRSRILLSLIRTPVSHVGSFIIDRARYLTLSNRPLSSGLQDWENERIPPHMSRNDTYSTVMSYVMHMLAIHDSRLRSQPNAVNNLTD